MMIRENTGGRGEFTGIVDRPDEPSALTIAAFSRDAAPRR
jgi:hypothetical protein